MTRYSTFKHKRNNTGLYFILLILMSFLLSISGIWVIVEFILYLVKDDPFNWTSLWLTGVTFVGEIFFIVKTFLSE